jgi:hypothetical protein
VDLVGERPAIAAEAHCVDRRQLIHEGHEVGRAKRVEHEAGQLIAGADGAAELVDVILVPENQEHPHIVSRRFDGCVLRRSNRQRQIVGRLTAGVDQLEGADRLDFAVLAQLEVFGAQRADRASVPAHHAHVDANQIGAGSEWSGRPLLITGLLPVHVDRDNRDRDNRVKHGQQARHPHAREH